MSEPNRIDKLLSRLSPTRVGDVRFRLINWDMWSSQEVSDSLRAYRYGHFPASTIRDWRRRNGFCKPRVEKPLAERQAVAVAEWLIREGVVVVEG